MNHSEPHRHYLLATTAPIIAVAIIAASLALAAVYRRTVAVHGERLSETGRTLAELIETLVAQGEDRAAVDSVATQIADADRVHGDLGRSGEPLITCDGIGFMADMDVAVPANRFLEMLRSGRTFTGLSPGKAMRS